MKLPQIYAKFEDEMQHVAFPPLSRVESASGKFTPILTVHCGLDESVSRLMSRGLRRTRAAAIWRGNRRPPIPVPRVRREKRRDDRAVAGVVIGDIWVVDER